LRCRSCLSAATPTSSILRLFFFLNDTATTEIYTLSLHDALPIWGRRSDGSCCTAAKCRHVRSCCCSWRRGRCSSRRWCGRHWSRSEEHTSELQSRENLVCRLLLEKKKKNKSTK